MADIDALVFIDTNILLDFYRIRRSDVSVSYLKLIDDHQDRLITGSQVEMEYKKNRQRVILESIRGMKSPDWNALGTPAILADTQPAKVITDKRSEINKQQEKLKKRISKILKNPSYNDSVYQTLQRLFRKRSDYNLNRENKQRFEMRKLARKRFVLGYPPRKKEDNSIGDAVNWEWIVRCAKKSGKDIIIVTRDTDYGVFYDGEAVLNDWLRQEFKERVSQRRNIYLTDKLSQAFKMISLAVSKEMIEEEERLIAEKDEYTEEFDSE